LDEGIIKVSEQLKSENKNDTTRKDVVSKVDDSSMVITAGLTVWKKRKVELKKRQTSRVRK
jgi:hypothetical protein